MRKASDGRCVPGMCLDKSNDRHEILISSEHGTKTLSKALKTHSPQPAIARRISAGAFGYWRPLVHLKSTGRFAAGE